MSSQESQPVFSDAELTLIKQSKSIYELTEKCRKHWSCNNYSLLKLIIKKSNSDEAKYELNRFQRVLYVRQKVKSLGKERLEDAKKYTEYENMVLILNEYYDDISLYQVEEAEKFLLKMTTLLSSEMKEVSKTNYESY